MRAIERLCQNLEPPVFRQGEGSVKHHKPDGNIDEEMSVEGKIILKHKNINKIDGCAKFHLSMETFEKIYETLGVKYPEAKYKKILNKKLKKNPAMKGCKIK
jgi:hypothetical protein